MNAPPERAAVDIRNAFLFFASFAFSIVLAEGLMRHVDGYSVVSARLGPSVGERDVKSSTIDQIVRATGVERDWFFSEPEPLPNRRPVPNQWLSTARSIEANPSTTLEFRSSDMFKAWNAAFVGPDPCRHPFLRRAPGHLFVYDPTDGAPRPPYRFLPNATTPLGLTTNQAGWRGRPIDVPRRDNVVRIVFVGSSTVVDFHHLPNSWPEYVGHWLNMWAQSKNLAVRFEVLNAARESIISTDIAAIVRNEILPLRPDLVVYHEGGNQFRAETIVEKMPDGPPVRPGAAAGGQPPSWLQTAARFSALAARIQGALGSDLTVQDGREWPKPAYRVVWPAGLDEADPDLAFPRLPVDLNIILRDLDRIRADIASIGGELSISAFPWMVKDGMVVDPVRHRPILEQLNAGYWPFRYRDIERLVAFQNRVFAKYASAHGLPFFDLVGGMPFDPDLFADAVHTNFAGSRVRAWVVFNLLVPTVEQRLASRAWPRTWPDGAPSTLPAFTPREISFDCKR